MKSRLIIGLMSIVAILPLSVSTLIGVVIGWLMYLIPNREKRVARINIALCFPGLDTGQQRRLLRHTLRHNGVMLMETAAAWCRSPESWLGKIELGQGGHLVDAALKEGKGIIAAGPHLGNWEVGIHYLASLAPLTVLYRPPRISAMEAFINRGRSLGGASVAPTSTQGVKQLLGALKAGQMAMILCDQEPKASGKQGSVFAPFFGWPASTMVLVNRLARKTDAKVLFWYLERLPEAGCFRMHWFEAPEGIDDPDPEFGAAVMNRALEKCILESPEQYLWIYKRFYTRPRRRIFVY
jgi:KDO2-lipid IV(A) lauroyltransferase